MAEFTSNAVQEIAASQNVLFTDVPIPGVCQGIVHREGSGVVTLTGGRCRKNNGCGCNNSNAIYRVSFGGNVAIPTDGVTATPITFAIAIDGEAIPTSSMTVTPSAVDQYWNIGTTIDVALPIGCCYTIAVENTGTAAANMRNANFTIDRQNN